MDSWKDFVDDLLPGASSKTPPAKKEPARETGVPIHSRTIDGVVYVRLEDVTKTLEMNKVLPKTAAAWRRRLNG